MAVVFDSVGFSAALDSLKTKVSDKLKSELKNAVTEEAKSELDDKNPNDAQAYTNFYNRVMPAGNFKKNIIPEEVYKAIMLEAAVRDKTISKGFDIGNLDGKTVSAIASWFQGIFGKKTITVGKYKVTMQSNFSAQVEFPSKKIYSVTWTLDDTAKNALKAYIENLKTYLSDYRYQIYGEIIKDGLSSLINEFVAEVAEGVDSASEKLINSFHEWALNKAADVAINKILPKTYKQIKAVEKNYKTFVSKLNDLKTYAGKVSDDSIKSNKKYTAFVTAYNKLGIGNYVDVVADYLSYEFLETVGGVFDQSKALITGTNSDNEISASGSYVTIKGGGGNDFISASGLKSRISGEAGNDKVLLKSSQGSINGGAGSDSIIVDGERNTVLGGANDDYIALFKGKNTITSGTGNDSIFFVGVGESVIKYNSGDGNDSIIGYDATDTIKITGNYSAQTSGQDVIITVGNSSIKLVGASGKKININDTVKAIGKLSNDDEVTEYTLPSGFDTTEYVKYKYGTNGDDDITNYSNKTKINGGAGNDYIYNGGDVTTINAGAGNDSIHNLGANVLINGDSDDDTIQNGVEDSGYWRKYDHDITINGGAGNDSIRNYFIDAVSINGGAGNDSILNTIDRFDNDNGTATIFGEKGNDYIFNENVSAMIDGGNSNDTINNRAGSSTIYGGTGNDSIYNSGGYTLIDGGNGNDFIRQSEGNNSTINGDAGNDKIEVYHGYRFYESVSNNYTIDGGDGNDLIELSGYSHDDLILFERNAGNDTVYGFTATDTLSVLGGGYVTASGNDIIAKSGSGAITLKDARFEMLNIIFSDGSDTSSALYAEGSKKNDSIVNSLSGSTINTGSGDDTVHNYGSQVSINGGAGDDYICNYKREVWNSETQKYGWITPDNVTIDGGKGNDFIYKAREEILVPITEGKNKGNYEIHNGGTNSLIEYTAGDGNDTIEGFGNTDTLRISGSNYSFVMKGDDLVITVGDEEIIWKDARHLHEHNIVRQVNTETLTNKNSAKVTIGADMDVADASKRTKAIKIVGNTFDNTILGGSKSDSLYGGKGADSLIGNAGNDKLYGQAGNDILKGGAGNDSLWGGAGNDSLWGDVGKDTFIYASGEGKDVIYGFENNDLLKITGAFNGTYSKSKSEVYFKVGTTSKAITLTDFSATSFNINGTNYKISGTKLVKK